LDKEHRRSGASFKEVVNRYLRLGLIASKQLARNLFVVVPRKLGLPPGLAYDSIAQFLDELESPLT